MSGCSSLNKPIPITECDSGMALEYTHIVLGKMPKRKVSQSLFIMIMTSKHISENN